jgi:hypothetical protein
MDLNIFNAKKSRIFLKDIDTRDGFDFYTKVWKEATTR